MTTLTNTIEERRKTFFKRFNWQYFLQDNLTGSRWLTIWVAFITLVTVGVFVGQLGSAPGWTLILTAVWAVGILMVVAGELFGLHTSFSRWLKDNLLSSISNTLVTLLIILLVAQVVSGIWQWGYVTATFDSTRTAPDLRSEGATWGVLWGARKLILTGTLAPEHTWRVILTGAMVFVLWLISFIATRPTVKTSMGYLQRISITLWLLAPIASYIFLAGLEYHEPFINIRTLLTGLVIVVAFMALLWFFKVIKLDPVSIGLWVAAWPIGYVIWQLIARTGIFPTINVDEWGGLLLTVIFAIFVNILSFPLGILLALGRRADVQGIPVWIVWPIALIATVYLLSTSTPELWTTSRNNVERALALWPLLIPIAAYFYQRSFQGNMVQAFSVLFIELIRGVPLITLLFMAIVMAPFFTASGSAIKNFWAVIVGYTIFSAAYMAELVRGGLQAIPKGQYEAADSLGFNVLQKYRFIILPQALRILIPPLAGSVIGTFKSSSLVALVGMFDLVGIVRGIIGNGQWLGLRSELYAFLFVLYFVVSSGVSWYSRRLEKRMGLGTR
ncbi:MAG: amino acid ABC transporter permease [Ardenticatenaceae bacterium]|nr:amino acid ABC transporter permease [Ardenticatenaceae bacterium]